MNRTRRLLLKLIALFFWWRITPPTVAAGAPNEPPEPFGDEFPNLDSLAVGEWWK